jgi:hypothetical protein
LWRRNCFVHSLRHGAEFVVLVTSTENCANISGGKLIPGDRVQCDKGTAIVLGSSAYKVGIFEKVKKLSYVRQSILGLVAFGIK